MIGFLKWDEQTIFYKQEQTAIHQTMLLSAKATIVIVSHDSSLVCPLEGV